MNKQLRALLARKEAARKEARAITDKCAAESRDPTAEEAAIIDAKIAEMKSLDADIERERALVAAETTSALDVRDNARIEGGAPAVLADPRFGFRSFGEFAQQVRRAGPNIAGIDERLEIIAAAPSTFGGETSGPDGGFLVPPEFSQDIFTYAFEQSSLMPMTDGYEVTRNGMVFPKDETTPWGTDGMRAYWQSEGTAGTPTKPKLGVTAMRLHKLMALVPLTEELMEDAPPLEQYISRKCGDSIRWKVNTAILNGTGNGQPVGALNGPAAMVIPKTSGQATQTLTALNLANLIAGLPEGSFAKSLWLVHPTVLPALFTMTLGNYPIYLPVGTGGLKESPYDGMLLGRPLMITQLAQPFSSQGDVQLHDLRYYRTIRKAGGVETAVSMHLYFDAAATAFRIMFRMDGQPTITNQIADANGSGTRSPFLQLASR